MRIEESIINGLLFREEYLRKVMPFIKPEYFSDKVESAIVSEISTFFSKYNTLPTKQTLKIEISNRKGLLDREVAVATSTIDGLEDEPSTNIGWLTAKTEKFCKDRAVYNAILESIKIIDGESKDLTQEAIPDILSKALAVTFDTNVGHDYLKDADSRYDFYHTKEDKIPFDLDLMNKITAGGLSRKSLNVVLAGTGAGKSLFMCHVASASLMQGKNVLYITMEMAEERIAERIDTNLLNVNMEDLRSIDRDSFNKRVGRIVKKTAGRLIIKEYPTASAHSGHFNALLRELRSKRNFTPDILIIDYLNICTSSRMKMGGSVNSYTLVKSIAEELRGLAVEYNVPILTATQTTRSGYNNSDVEITDTSESFGLPATADLMIALVRSEEMDELNQIMIKQLKNRYSDPTKYRKFVVGIDRNKMKLYDLEESAQDLSEQGSQDNNESTTRDFRNNSRSRDFSNFKV